MECGGWNHKSLLWGKEELGKWKTNFKKIGVPTLEFMIKSTFEEKPANCWRKMETKSKSSEVMIKWGLKISLFFGKNKKPGKCHQTSIKQFMIKKNTL